MDINRIINNLKYKKKLLIKTYKENNRLLNREYVFKQIREGNSEVYQVVNTNLLFEINEVNGKKEIDIPEDIKFKIDYSNINFKDVNVKDYDFTNMKNVYINPQEVFNKDLRNCILDGVHITGNFDDVYITNTNFTNSIGALIDPQNIYNKNLTGTILTDSIVVDNFYDVVIHNTIFNDCNIISIEDKEKIYSLKI